MKNITLTVDEDVLEKVRVVAAQNRTSVNAMVREYLTEIAGRDEKLAKARHGLLQLMDSSGGRMQPGAKFNREETYER